jgi:thiazole synthase
MQQSIKESKSEVLTVSLRRQSNSKDGNEFWDYIKNFDVNILPNTAGCNNAKDAITTANMGREIFDTNWVKLEVIGDDYTLQPDPYALVEAAKELISQGFEVFPYCTYDLVTCAKLLDVGCNILMPWASPIGSGMGIINKFSLEILRKRFPKIPMIIDAGIGRPSDAITALEMGFDAVLVNSAVALSHDPVCMASAFKHAVISGRKAYLSGIMPSRDCASPSTPVLGQPFWESK